MNSILTSFVPRSATIGVAIAAALACTALASGQAAAQESACAMVGVHESLILPDGARAMTAAELYELYRNKSWKWCDGAGYMNDHDGRRFSAWSGLGDAATWAEGRWSVTDSGRLCLNATWHSKGGATLGKSCFGHRIHDETIYQRKEPDGGWYIFRHAPPEDSDEFKKLVPEDLVTPTLDKIKASREASKPLDAANIKDSKSEKTE